MFRNFKRFSCLNVAVVSNILNENEIFVIRLTTLIDTLDFLILSDLFLGPTRETASDFLRMLVEKEVKVIVMLTQVYEGEPPMVKIVTFLS